MKLSEAEIEVIAALMKAESCGAPTDRVTLEPCGRGSASKEDWSRAFQGLVERGLLRCVGGEFTLTASGRSLAATFLADRVNQSWNHYRRFFPLAHGSDAHSRFCERVYGLDLCQDGQADMTCIDDVLERLNLRPGDRVLDLGCGAGGLAEYISDCTNALVTGVDNSAAAIAVANARTTTKRERLSFFQGDMNLLQIAPNSYDAAVAFDSITWAQDIPKVIRRLAGALGPGGELCILAEQRISEGDPAGPLEGGKTSVARALSGQHLCYEIEDLSDLLPGFWSLAKETAEALREDYVRDGAEFICDTWLKYANETFLPAIREHRIRRYLYHVVIAQS